MKRQGGRLAEHYKARTDNWINSLGVPDTAFGESIPDDVLDPGAKQIAHFTDEELHEAIAREPNSKLGSLCSSELRKRESWRTPARWALLISTLSLVIALMAFVRTL